LAGPENKGSWNGLGRAGVPANFVLGEQVAVGSLYYFIQASANFNQPESLRFQPIRNVLQKNIAVRFVQAMSGTFAMQATVTVRGFL